MVDFWDVWGDDVAPKRGKMVDHLTPFGAILVKFPDNPEPELPHDRIKN